MMLVLAGLSLQTYGILLLLCSIAFLVLKRVCDLIEPSSYVLLQMTRRRPVLARSRVMTLKQYTEILHGALEVKEQLLQEFFRELGLLDLHK